MGNITSAGEGAPDTGFISAPHLRNVVAPFRDDCGSLANLEVTTTHVTGIDLSGLRTVEGALEIVGRHDGSSQLEHLDLRNLVAVFGYNCPTGFDGAASSSGGMGADGMDTPVTALPDAFKPDAASTDDFFAAWVEATANITDFILHDRGSLSLKRSRPTRSAPLQPAAAHLAPPRDTVEAHAGRAPDQVQHRASNARQRRLVGRARRDRLRRSRRAPAAHAPRRAPAHARRGRARSGRHGCAPRATGLRASGSI